MGLKFTVPVGLLATRQAPGRSVGRGPSGGRFLGGCLLVCGE